MKLKFEVDQTEAFSRGVNCPKRLVTVEVDPANLTQALREAIACRMVGTTVHCADAEGDYAEEMTIRIFPTADRLVAPVPTWEGFMEALRADEAALAPTIQRIRHGFERIKRSGLYSSTSQPSIKPLRQVSAPDSSLN